MTVHSADITAMLKRWREGDLSARDSIVHAIYPVLRDLAGQELRGGRLSIRPTEVVHEAYIRLCDQRSEWSGRTHFLAIAAQVIRRVVVDAARRHDADKRGGGASRVGLEAADAAGDLVDPGALEWLELDRELERLTRRDPSAARILELRYFGGLTNEEVAECLDIGVATVVRHWQFGKAWLQRRLAATGE